MRGTRGGWGARAWAMRFTVSSTTAIDVMVAAARNTRPVVSVPAVSAWTVLKAKSGKLEKWIARHHLAGSLRRRSEVSSIASSRYIDTTPHATASGRHLEAKGTRMSAGPKSTYTSATSAPTWTAVNITAAPPRKRCRSSIQFGRSRPRLFVEIARPHSTLAASNTHPTMPLARAMYQYSCSLMTSSPMVRRGRGARRRRGRR